MDGIDHKAMSSGITYRNIISRERSVGSNIFAVSYSKNIWARPECDNALSSWIVSTQQRGFSV
jgi:hypothetical protein